MLTVMALTPQDRYLIRCRDNVIRSIERAVLYQRCAESVARTDPHFSNLWLKRSEQAEAEAHEWAFVLAHAVNEDARLAAVRQHAYRV